MERSKTYEEERFNDYSISLSFRICRSICLCYYKEDKSLGNVVSNEESISEKLNKYAGENKSALEKKYNLTRVYSVTDNCVSYVYKMGNIFTFDSYTTCDNYTKKWI